MSKLLLLTILLGCGRPLIANPELYQHVSLYERLANRIVTTPITFEDLPTGHHMGPTVAGQCRKIVHLATNQVVRYIVIDPDYWRTLYPIQQEMLILHELGHCEANLKHSPNGIMNESMMSFQYYIENRDDILKRFAKEIKHVRRL